MNKEVPYYILDEDGNSQSITSNNEAYIDDEDLRELLIDFLGDSVSEDEIQKILDAASDENLSEEDFDKLIDNFILNNKK
ncbi:hypothetical protein [Methanobrevibacter sp.]|uniref:hypothetical protein n=1 Tax=Methanobrevibacter sp. TaxID=66852 RepID=UPI0026E0826D|nr:hypothetical protein [Methanobrevibacter sp.]MDO5859688.1 hypothetical protein [Methanobrevibacter sp.]